MFVAVDDHVIAFPLRDGDGGDFLGKEALFIRLGPALLATRGESVLVFARHVMVGGDVVGCLGHGIHAELRLHFGIHKAPADGGVIDGVVAGKGGFGLGHDERCTRHALDATGDGQIHVAGADRPGGGTDGIHAAGAEPVDRGPRDIDRQACQQSGHARDVAVVFARLVGAAHDDIIDTRPIHRGVPLHQCLQRDRGQIVGANRREGAAVTANGGALRVADECLHGGTPVVALQFTQRGDSVQSKCYEIELMC